MEASLIARLWRFPRKSRDDQRRSILTRIHRWMPRAIIPIKLSFNVWWLAQHEYSTDMILNSGYENAETAFVQRILHEGMTVLDIGANRGYYTMLASRKVGGGGRVIAFEPSPRDRRFLKANLLVNRCKNVIVEPVALGSELGETDLYLVQGYSTGCHCLRPPDPSHKVKRLRANVRTLDEYMDAGGIRKVDFVKMDVEGGELEVLRGAANLLAQRPRPVILCELLDQLTLHWGYAASDTPEHLEKLGFRWFGLSEDGKLGAMPERGAGYDGNFVAVPEEKLGSLWESGLVR